MLFLGCCGSQGVAMHLLNGSECTMLPRPWWLPGHYYAVAKMFQVIFNVLHCCFQGIAGVEVLLCSC